jgi:hypothetical protein
LHPPSTAMAAVTTTPIRMTCNMLRDACEGCASRQKS